MRHGTNSVGPECARRYAACSPMALDFLTQHTVCCVPNSIVGQRELQVGVCIPVTANNRKAEAVKKIFNKRTKIEGSTASGLAMDKTLWSLRGVKRQTNLSLQNPFRTANAES